MAFIDHTQIWLRGEAVDMTAVSVAGFALLLLAGGLWRFASTPLGQALVIPTTLIAVLFLGFGFYSVVSTPGQITKYTAAFDLDPSGFVQAERDRIAAFEALYRYTLIGATIAFLSALGIYVLTDHATWRAIAVAFVFLGLSGLIVDGFSKERATVYASAIDRALEDLRLEKSMDLEVSAEN
ncbi:MAG: hypothetical protein OXC72_14015 [Roseovarius sp.]|nr:hypothetical protein [Roseovarius sp.]MCY4292851.1 hypothetical protein [Roseovarius sp.]